MMSFDKNRDGRIGKDELPERMQDLPAKGDTNKDGVLDRDEIRKLSADLAPNEPENRRGPRGPGERSGPGDGISVRTIERAVNDLRLTDTKKETATTALKTHQGDVRRMSDLARAELVLMLSPVLDDEEVKKVESALARLPDPAQAGPDRRGGGPSPGFPRGGPPSSDDRPRPRP